jgi:glycosyltransferase involved in cell wall biosynthesis
VSKRAPARACRIAVGDLTAPCLRFDLDVAEPIPDIGSSEPFATPKCMWSLVKMQTEPVGILMMALPEGGVGKYELVNALTEGLGPALSLRAKGVGATWPRKDPAAPLDAVGPSRFLTSRADVLNRGPRITVAVCTREQPQGLERCLASLVTQVYPRFSILVVDNAPVTTRIKSIVARARSESIAIDYVVEPRAGLSWARNRAWQWVPEGIIAWIDDDEVADRFWLAELARGFVEHPSAAAVSGIMLPAELRTPAQIQFEQYGGHHKQRGFATAVFSPLTGAEYSPLFPLPPFGTGGNMAFRRESLAEIGGFDTALGAGTLSGGAEDTRAFTEVLLDGGTVVYQPTAVTYHFHRESAEALRRQMFSYGAGLTAYYMSVLMSRPRCLRDVVGLVPRFLNEALGSASLRSGDLPAEFPANLRWANRGGLVTGPFRYLGARVIARRLDRLVAGTAERRGSVGESDP